MPTIQSLRADDPSHLGDYRLLGCIGAGGQGVVYLAESPSGERVAVKAIHPRMVTDRRAMERFIREIQTASSVAEFSTVRVLDAAVDHERPYVVSEYVDGPSLAEIVGEEGPYSPGALHRLAVSTAASLAAIHRAGVVHRDFKPGNVLIGPDGPQVIDFGIARALDSVTSTTGGIGTPAYMSPEQLSGGDVAAASDIFSWAGTMIYAATGQPPFGRDFPALMYRILQADPDLSALPADLRPLVARCLAKDPADRPAAPEVLMALVGGDPDASAPEGAGGEAGGAGLRPHAGTGIPPVPESAAHPGDSRRKPPPRRRRPAYGGKLPLRYLLPGIALAVVAVAVAAFVYANGRPGSGPSGEDGQGTVSSSLLTLTASPEVAKEVVAEWTPEALEAAVPYGEGIAWGPEGNRTGAVSTGDPATVPPYDMEPPSGEKKPGHIRANVPQTLGKVFFRVGERRRWCSATSVNSESGNLLVTAGHCLYDPARHEAVASLVFVPAYDRGQAPFGIYPGSAAALHPKFTSGGDRGYDYAFVTVHGAGGKRLADAVGAQGLAWNQSGRQTAYVFGYPAEADPGGTSPSTGGRLRWCFGVSSESSTGGGRAQKCSLTPGADGGPLIIRYEQKRGVGYVGGVVSAFDDTDGNGRSDRVLSPSFNDEARETYLRVSRLSSATL
ncbi:V8-like Glu-specific endopeptidase [Streptosporangium album]|uniref:V8-like Glu-specific endopeptidase n=1 Tax=Streptosporangium album TaxID=47479 RepID=A0A7W7RQR4_9ACTN|nr:protein kinase [Streptosporangium album]MBB4935918.1 V8-like Glu-specific endopeptidase [Streptosporangium album]